MTLYLARKELEVQANLPLASGNDLHKRWRQPSHFHELVHPHLLHALAIGDFHNATNGAVVELFLPAQGHAQGFLACASTQVIRKGITVTAPHERLKSETY